MKSDWIRLSVVAVALWLGLALGHTEDVTKADSVTFEKGAVLYPDQGKLVEATNSVSIVGDILVRTNGMFTVKKGKDRQLKEGQTIGSDGMITSPDGSVVPVVDHLTVKNGRVQVVKDGDGTPLGGEYTLPDGSRISPDGSVKGRDGRLRRLLDGQLMKLDGTSLPTTDTVSLQDGKVILFKDGGRLEMRRGQIMAMSDGSKVNGDGFVIRANGSKVTLKEGETLKLPGVLSPGK